MRFHRNVYITFQSCCQSIWLSVGPELGAEILLFTTLKGVGIPSTIGSYLNYDRLLKDAQRFERQPIAETRLNDKVHLLYAVIPSRMGELVVSSIETNTESQAK